METTREPLSLEKLKNIIRSIEQIEQGIVKLEQEADKLSKAKEQSQDNTQVTDPINKRIEEIDKLIQEYKGEKQKLKQEYDMRKLAYLKDAQELFQEQDQLGVKQVRNPNVLKGSELSSIEYSKALSRTLYPDLRTYILGEIERLGKIKEEDSTSKDIYDKVQEENIPEVKDDSSIAVTLKAILKREEREQRNIKGPRNNVKDKTKLKRYLVIGGVVVALAITVVATSMNHYKKYVQNNQQNQVEQPIATATISEEEEPQSTFEIEQVEIEYPEEGFKCTDGTMITPEQIEAINDLAAKGDFASIDSELLKKVGLRAFALELENKINVVNKSKYDYIIRVDEKPDGTEYLAKLYTVDEAGKQVQGANIMTIEAGTQLGKKLKEIISGNNESKFASISDLTNNGIEEYCTPEQAEELEKNKDLTLTNTHIVTPKTNEDEGR